MHENLNFIWKSTKGCTPLAFSTTVDISSDKSNCLIIVKKDASLKLSSLSLSRTMHHFEYRINIINAFILVKCNPLIIKIELRSSAIYCVMTFYCDKKYLRISGKLKILIASGLTAVKDVIQWTHLCNNKFSLSASNACTYLIWWWWRCFAIMRMAARGSF